LKPAYPKAGIYEYDRLTQRGYICQKLTNGCV